MPVHAGPLSVMVRDHAAARLLAGAAERSLDEAGGGRLEAVRAVWEYLENYATLILRHVEREESMLFPMADQLLSAEDLQWLRDSLAAEASDVGSKDVLNSCRRALDELSAADTSR